MTTRLNRHETSTVSSEKLKCKQKPAGPWQPAAIKSPTNTASAWQLRMFDKQLVGGLEVTKPKALEQK